MKITEQAVREAINAWFEETRESVKSVAPLPEQARRMRLALEVAIPHLTPKPVDVAVVRKLLNDIDELVANSGGVFGLHQNGDPSPWDELLEGGEFEGWLRSVEELRRAISAEPAQGEQWQPIETAPKDVLVVVYTPPQPHDHPDAFHVDFDYIDTGIADDYWYNHGEAREHFECVGKPDCWSGGIPYDAPYTHWMPLPAAPTSEAGRAALAQGGE